MFDFTIAIDRNMYFLPTRIDTLMQSPSRQASPAPLSPGARTICTVSTQRPHWTRPRRNSAVCNQGTGNRRYHKRSEHYDDIPMLVA